MIGCRPDELLSHFGNIDVYVFDQMLRGRLTADMRVLDAGCGDGRNSQFLMRSGADVYCVDADPQQVARVRKMAGQHAPALSPDHFQESRLDRLPFPDDHFDAVVCSAVLHFAEDEEEFETSVRELLRVLASGGVLFTRLASTIGMEDRVENTGGRWHRMPDGTDRFLVDEDYLHRIAAELGAELADPIKTTNVQNLRAMTTWVLKKPEVP